MKIQTMLLALSLTSALTFPAAVAEAQDATSCKTGIVQLTGLRSQGNAPYANVIEAWQKANPCAKVEFTEVPFSQLADKISVLAASDNPPDVLVYDGPNTQSYAAAGILLALDPYLPAGFKDDVLPATLAEHSYQGKVYSPGMEQTTIGLYYNKTLTDAAGITPPPTLATAWTWSQAIEAFKKCQQGPADNPTVWGLGPTRFGNGQPGIVYRDLLFQRSAGDPKADPKSSLYKTYWAQSPDAKEVDGWLNTPEAIAALKIYSDIFNVYKVAPKTGIPNAFIDGKACFYIDTPAVGNALLKDPKIQWGITPFPYFKTPIVHTGSTTLGATQKSKHPEVAAKFVVDMSSGEYLTEILRQRGNLPTLRSLNAKFPVFEQYPMKLFRDQLEQWGQPRPPSPKFAEYDKLVSDALKDIALGSDPKERMDAAVRRLGPILRR
ncbi:MAG: sugar ABC transporter substrate-binding protein [Proteobacteria bacterium]|nr:sugar ABC transporter substrate-binding protein [Pseudomonadota bacterium]MBI3496905.1 sugar ABC transporter substrate-binding protein [Pseudomonadota bacterium]